MEDIKNIVVGGATVVFAGQPLGFTEGACVLKYDHEDLVVNKVQQKGGVLKRIRITDDLTVKITILEMTLENIKLAWGINSAITQGTNTRKLKGDQSGDLPEGVLIIYTKAPNGKNRTYYFYKMVLSDATEINLDAREYSKITLTFQMVWDSNYSDRFYFEEEYAPVTPG